MQCKVSIMYIQSKDVTLRLLILWRYSKDAVNNIFQRASIIWSGSHFYGNFAYIFRHSVFTV